MIRHKPHCAITQSTGMHDDADCTCGSTRRTQRKSAPPSISKALDVLQLAIREELRNLRMCAVEAAVSLSLDKAAITAATYRINQALLQFERDLFNQPELPGIKCDGDHAAPACHDKQCWRGVFAT